MKHLIIGTAGHVDHGKTSLIKALTQIDCDTHKAEKERGITINLGFSHIELPDGISAGIIDVPGHKDFIDTMVSGACSFDMVMMVIAADSGIMPQTIEHLNIINMLGVEKGVVVITKTDLVDEDLLELVELEIMDQFAGTTLEDAPIIPVSSANGAGIDHLLIQLAEIGQVVSNRPIGKLFRMYIDRLFDVKGLGYVATGSVLGGKLSKGAEVHLLPGDKKYKVRGLQRHAKNVEFVSVGDRAAINLVGLKSEDFEKGMMLCDELVDATSLVDAKIKLFKDGGALPRRANVIFHAGTFKTQARMQLIDKDKLMPGEEAHVQIALSKSGVLFDRDRFIIRNTSSDKTLGGGQIFDVQPLIHRKRTEDLINRMEELSEAVLGDNSIVPLMMAELKKQQAPMSLLALSEIIEVSEEELSDACEEVHGSSVMMYKAGSGFIVIDQFLENKFIGIITEFLKAWHQKYPIIESGLSIGELPGKLAMKKTDVNKLYLEQLLNRLKEEKLLDYRNNNWLLHSHKAKIDKKTQEQLDWLEWKVGSYGNQKPTMLEIEQEAREQKINKDRLSMLIQYFVNKKQFYFIDNEVLHADVVDKARKELLKELIRLNKGINEGDFRILINGTKKIVHPLIAIFKNEGLVIQDKFIINITEKGRAYTP